MSAPPSELPTAVQSSSPTGDSRLVCLLSAPAYEQPTGKRSIVDWLQTGDDVEFEPARLTAVPRAADL